MPRAIRTPRINNNDDFVRLLRFAVDIGAPVKTGELVAEIETDKANFSVEAEEPGYVLSFEFEEGAEIPVGSVLLWLGDSPDEKIAEKVAEKVAGPAATSSTSAKNGAPGAQISLKAAILLREYKLDQSAIPHEGDRLTVADIESYIQTKGLAKAASPAAPTAAKAEPKPSAAGTTRDLNSEERGMLRTVSWHRDFAVPGFLEIPYDTKPWLDYAAEFKRAHKLMFDPLLALTAYRLVSLARQKPVLNSTMSGESRYLYDEINLGFTVQSGETLYMVVVKAAETLTEKQFVDRLSALQMAAMRKALKPEDMAAPTLAFTSMARWPVTRHMPILPPHVSLIVAHVGRDADGNSHLGATYDHRVLTGFDVARLLGELSRPAEPETQEVSEGNSND